MLFGLVAVSAVLPSLLLILFFHKKDANPEPARVLWATISGTQVAMLVVGALVLAGGFALFFSGRKKLHRNLLASRGIPVSRR